MLLVSVFFWHKFLLEFFVHGHLINFRGTAEYQNKSEFCFRSGWFVNIWNGFPPPPLKSQMIRFQTVRDGTLM